MDALPENVYVEVLQDKERGKHGNGLDFFEDVIATDVFADSSHGLPVWNPEHYPALVARYAEDIAERIGCVPAIPSWTMLAVAAGLAPDQYCLQVKRHDPTWREAPRLWVMTLADPSAKKSPAMREVLRPVHNAEWERFETYQHAREEYEATINARRKRENKGEALSPDPEEPRLARLIIRDATVEAISDALEHNERGMLAVHDELSGWFGAMDAYRPSGANKDRGDWLKLYEGGLHTVDRVKRGHKFIRNWSASLYGNIQPDALRDMIKEKRLKLQSDGLLQRVLVIPAAKGGFDVDREPDTSKMAAWEALVERLAGLQGGATFRLDEPAQQRLDAARRRILSIAQTGAVDQRLAGALEKGGGQLARLVCIFHLIETCGVGSDPASVTEVDETSVHTAARLYFEFVVPSLQVFYRQVVGKDAHAEAAAELADYILVKAKNTITARDLYRDIRYFKTRREEIEGAAALLDLCGWLEPVPEEQRRRDSRAWWVNPRVHEQFKERALQERKRRAEARQMILEVANSRRQH